jgi:hypothetical protein
MFYHTLGQIPHKRHTQFPRPGSALFIADEGGHGNGYPLRFAMMK